VISKRELVLLEKQRSRCAVTFSIGILLAALPVLLAGTNSNWQILAPGMELGSVSARATGAAEDSRVTVLRMDPKLWELTAIGVGQNGEPGGLTARGWCEKQKFVAATNAGMYETDLKSHIGYMRNGERVYNGHVNKYQSLAAFGPRAGKEVPRFRIFDLDAPGVTLQSIQLDYESAVQNLRLVKRPGSNQWPQQERRWSEAALGEDDTGRMLFIFSRAPFSMYDLNRELLAADIGLVAAQHLEGGPEAQLYLHAGGVEREMFGSYETPFRENDANPAPWPVPNILGVRPRVSSPQKK
jgi:hypothetical protein